MKVINQLEDEAPETGEESFAPDPPHSVRPDTRVRGTGVGFSSAVVGELIGLDSGSRVPLVLYPGQPGTAPVTARSIIDLNKEHIGRQVLLMLDNSADGAPILIGFLREEAPSPQSEPVGIEVDGDRLFVSAERQIVLRCGKASITLTREGKVLIYGTYLSCHSSGVNRITGGSVEIN